MNAFDQFDAPAANAFDAFDQPKVNPFDQFDAASPASVSSPDSTTPSASFDSASVKDMDSLIASEKAITQDFAGAKPLISGGAINPAAIGSHILSKLVDNFNTAIGAEAEANQDPEIQKLRQQGESPVIQLPKPELTGVPSGIIRGLETTAETLTTPANLETVAALSAAPAGLTKVAAAGFGLMMAKDVPSKIKAAMSEPSSAGKAQAATEALAEAAMAFFSFKHATKGSVPSFKEWMRKKSGVDIEQPDVSPYVVDSLLLSRQKALDGIEDVSPGLQDQRREIVKSVNEQLGMMPSDLVKARTEQLGKSPPPVEGEAPPVSTEGPPDTSGRSRAFSQALKESGITEEPAAPSQVGSEAVSPRHYPGAASIEEPIKNELEQTSLKRAVVDPQRLLRGDETISTEERAGAVAAVRVAEDMAHEDPTHVESIISRIVDEGDKRISESEAASLLHERRRLMNERAAWEERLANGEDVNTAKTQLTEIGDKLDRVDRASRSAGSEWHAVGVMYQQMIKDDFSLASMESRKLASFEGKLTPEDLKKEKAKVKEEYEKINELRRQFEASEKKDEKLNLDSETQHFVEATINELGKSYLEKPSFGKKVFDIARKIVDRWKDEADGLSEEIKKGLGGESGGVGGVGGGPGGKKLGEQAKNRAALVTNIAKVIRAKVGEFGLSKAETLAELVTEYGAKIKTHFENAWTKAQQMIAQESIDPKAKEIVKDGISKKGEKTTVEAKAAAKAEAVAGEPLSHKVVYDYVESLINSGVHGADALMKAAHEGLKEHFPELTERDVRRAFGEYGKVKFPSKEAVKVELAETRRITQLQESIDRLKEGQDPLHTGLQRDKATQQIREKTKELNELLKKHAGPPSPEKLASRDQAKQTALRNAIEDLDKQLRTGEKPMKGQPVPDSAQTEQLRAERDAMKAKLQEIEDEANPGKTPEERYNETRVKQAEKRTKELEALTAAGKFTKPPKKTPFIKSPETKAAEFKLAKAQEAFNRGVFEQKLKDRHPVRKVLETGRDVLNLARAVRTSFDLSAVLRQGGFIALGHPIRAVKGFPAMMRAFASEKGLFELNKEIQSRPNAELYKSSKLHLNDPNDPHLSKMEEAYMSRWAQKIPGVSHSERAYTGFLNRLRADSFDAMAKSIGHPPTPEEAKAISNFVNVATGRGNLGSVASGAVSLNTAFFAPRYVLSRFELLAGQPLYRGTASTRIAVAKEYGRFLGGLAVVYALAKASGATINPDPRSSDFGKLKFGNTRVDMLSGLSQTAVLLSRLGTGKISTPHGTQSIRGNVPFGQPDSASVLGRFLRTKLSPWLGSSVDVLSGKDLSGNKVTPATMAQNLVVPLSFGDIYDAMRDQGVAKGTALGILAIFGAGVQNYNRHGNN